MTNENIDEIALHLNKTGVNVEIQSINKKDNLVIVVLKLSDFNLDHLTIIETYLQKNKLVNKEIQFFSSTE